MASLADPCHRVIGASGALTGFAGGLAAKQTLLTLEGWPASGFGAKAGRAKSHGHAAQGSLFPDGAGV
ncbi:MAG TPA: hypothetical protein DCW29_23045 [Janthinobacterium sp.]|nr:hypothetical protein [Janthinobacterium sp.]